MWNLISDFCVILYIRSFKQTANIIFECFFPIIVCIVLLLSPSTNLENPFRKTIFANLLFCSQGAVIQPMLRLLVIHSSCHHLRWPIIGHQCFEGVPSSVKYLVNDNSILYCSSSSVYLFYLFFGNTLCFCASDIWNICVLYFIRNRDTSTRA